MSAIIPYLQPGAITNVQSDITDLQALSGMPDNSLTHGTFSGVTIPDGQTTKQALQALETEVELRDSDIIQSKVGTGAGYYMDTSSQYVEPEFDTAMLSGGDFTTVTEFSLSYLGTDLRVVNRESTSGVYVEFDSSGLRWSIGAATALESGMNISDFEIGEFYDVVCVFNWGQTLDVHVNGKKVISADISSATSTADNFRVGGISGTARAKYSTFKVYNRALTAAEVATVSNGQYLGFADYGASGAPSYESNFSVDANGWTAIQATATGGVDGIGGQDDVLRLQVNTAASSHYMQKSDAFTKYKRYRVSGKYYIPSSNSHVNGIRIYPNNSLAIVADSSPEKDVWISFSAEVIPDGNFSETLIIVSLDDGSLTTTDPGGDDKIYIKDIVITPLGLVLDLNPNGAAPAIWADASGNGYNGTVTGATLINQQPLYADTFVSLTNLPTSSAGLATGQVWNDSGTLKIV